MTTLLPVPDDLDLHRVPGVRGGGRAGRDLAAGAGRARARRRAGSLEQAQRAARVDREHVEVRRVGRARDDAGAIRRAGAAELQHLHARGQGLVRPGRLSGQRHRVAVAALIDAAAVGDHRPGAAARRPADGVAVLEVVAEHVAGAARATGTAACRRARRAGRARGAARAGAAVVPAAPPPLPARAPRCPRRRPRLPPVPALPPRAAAPPARARPAAAAPAPPPAAAAPRLPPLARAPAPPAPPAPAPPAPAPPPRRRPRPARPAGRAQCRRWAPGSRRRWRSWSGTRRRRRTGTARTGPAARSGRCRRRCRCASASPSNRCTSPPRSRGARILPAGARAVAGAVAAAGHRALIACTAPADRCRSRRRCTGLRCRRSRTTCTSPRTRSCSRHSARRTSTRIRCPPCTRAPGGFGPQLPFTHAAPATQSAAVVHVDRHLPSLPHRYWPHESLVAAPHVPSPSHSAAYVTVDAAQPCALADRAARVHRARAGAVAEAVAHAAGDAVVGAFVARVGADGNVHARADAARLRARLAQPRAVRPAADAVEAEAALAVARRRRTRRRSRRPASPIRRCRRCRRRAAASRHRRARP